MHQSRASASSFRELFQWNHSISVPFGRRGRMNTMLTRRGKTAEWRETRFKSNADVASRITFLGDLPRQLFCALPLARAFSVATWLQKEEKRQKKREKERFLFRLLILSISNFECEQEKKEKIQRWKCSKKKKEEREREKECTQPPPPNINFGTAVWVKGLKKQISQNVLVSATTYPLYLEYFRGSVAIVTLGRFGLIGTLGNTRMHLSFLPSKSAKVVQLLNESLRI